ncbi:MAG TPA: hypothetical protein GX738_01875 [Firmicutes bacterium]|nr:hypothetical protein [Bacillota bacterium]
MQKTVIGLFTSEEAAREAIATLRKKGYTENEINLVQKDDRSRGNRGVGSPGMTNSIEARDLDLGTGNITDGVTSGATWGGLAGLALGAGALAVPGVGPLLAAGPIASAITGAATGGIAGGLLDWGIPEERGRHYEKRVKEGDLLAIVKVSENRAKEASAILRNNGAKDVEVHDAR